MKYEHEKLLARAFDTLDKIQRNKQIRERIEQQKRREIFDKHFSKNK